MATFSPVSVFSAELNGHQCGVMIQASDGDLERVRNVHDDAVGAVADGLDELVLAVDLERRARHDERVCVWSAGGRPSFDRRRLVLRRDRRRLVRPRRRQCLLVLGRARGRYLGVERVVHCTSIHSLLPVHGGRRPDLVDRWQRRTVAHSLRASSGRESFNQSCALKRMPASALYLSATLLRRAGTRETRRPSSSGLRAATAGAARRSHSARRGRLRKLPPTLVRSVGNALNSRLNKAVRASRC